MKYHFQAKKPSDIDSFETPSKSFPEFPETPASVSHPKPSEKSPLRHRSRSPVRTRSRSPRRDLHRNSGSFQSQKVSRVTRGRSETPAPPVRHRSRSPRDIHRASGSFQPQIVPRENRGRSPVRHSFSSTKMRSGRSPISQQKCSTCQGFGHEAKDCGNIIITKQTTSFCPR